MRRRRRRSRYDGYDSYGFPPYVSVGERQARAAREARKLEKRGVELHPVRCAGRDLARTFWGRAWCRNLEAFSDYSNRLPRGRSYARNGLVLDLEIGPGEVRALVCGTRLYEVKVSIEPIRPARWQVLVDRSAAEIDSLVDLLRGELSDGVMAVLTRPREGLFPEPGEIRFECSCPDWASMCKHVAATLYGVGGRLDEEPGLLFRLRQVDETELVRAAPAVRVDDGEGELGADELGEVFGIELDAMDEPDAPAEAPAPRRDAKPGTRKTGRRGGGERAGGGRRAGAGKRDEAGRRAGGRGPDAAGGLASGPWPPLEGEPVAARELVSRGISRSRIQSWLRSGVLERSARRGVYVATARTAPTIAGLPDPGEPLTARELTGRGIPHSRIQSWLRSGVLERSAHRGVYVVTARTAAAVMGLKTTDRDS